MNQWDFGRPPTGDRDAAPSAGPGGWAADDFWAPGDRWPAEDDWAQDEGTAPYPITYERDAAAAAYSPWPPAPYPDERDADRDLADGTERWRDHDEPGHGDSHLPGGGARRGRRGRPGPSHRGRGKFAYGGARPRWLIPAAGAVLAAATGASAILLTSGHPSSHVSQGGGFTAPTALPSLSPSASAPVSPSATAASAAPLTLGQAQGVLTGYTTVNNGANAERSGTLLAVAETGSSFAIDTGLYQRQRGLGAAPYPAFVPVSATYYIPGNEPPGGPRWFVVRVANAFSAHPKQVTSIEYLLFTQATPGGAWRNAIEPYLLPGTTAPRIAVGANGLATAVSPAATSVAVAPGRLAAVTAAALDGTGGGVADPGNLSDLADKRFWRGKLPGATVTDTHAPAAGAERAGVRAAHQRRRSARLLHRRRAADGHRTAGHQASPDGPRLLLTRPGTVPSGNELPGAVRRLRPARRRWRAARGGRLLRDHRHELALPRHPESWLHVIEPKPLRRTGHLGSLWRQRSETARRLTWHGGGGPVSVRSSWSSCCSPRSAPCARGRRTVTTGATR